MLRLPALLLTLLCVVPVYGQIREGERAQKREPHLVPMQDRIAARTDARLARERVIQRTGSDASRWTDVIDGRQHPELFLPTELFESLVRRGYVDVALWREIHERDLAAAGLPDTFWAELEGIAAPYIDSLRRQRAAAVRGRDNPRLMAESRREIATAGASLCRQRAAALRGARDHFGPAFDEFLYKAIAPGHSISTDDPLDPAKLRAREDGCS